jgi:hypothetical protein
MEPDHETRSATYDLALFARAVVSMVSAVSSNEKPVTSATVLLPILTKPSAVLLSWIF